MHLVFYAPNHTGHHFAYLSRMLPGFLDLPIEISIATTPEAVASVEFGKTLKPLEERFQVSACCHPSPSRAPLSSARHRFRELRQLVKALQPDHLAICYADGLWQVAYLTSLVGRRAWPPELVVEAWLYRGGLADAQNRGWGARIRRRLFTRLLQTNLFQKLHLDDELLFDFARSRATQPEVVLTPNPITLGAPMSKAESRAALDVPEEGQLISLSGMIDERKGAVALLDALQHLAQTGSHQWVRVLFAGPHSFGVRRKLEEAPFKRWIEERRIISIDRFVDEEEMYATAAASDLAVAPYPNHSGRSSVILWAAAAGRPSLGPRQGCIGHVIREEGLGWTCDVRDIEKLAAAIDEALDAPWTAGDLARVRKYAEFHRVENYQRVASQLIRDRLHRMGGNH